jgi:multicomponent K+:H+ antiporter subunit A
MTASAVVGAPLPMFHLAIWHGFSPALAMSAMALAGGVALLALYPTLELARRRAPGLEARWMFEGIVGVAVSAARTSVDLLHSNKLQHYAFIIVVTVASVGTFAYLSGTDAPGTRPLLDVSIPASVGWVVLLVACGIAVCRHRDRLLMLVVTGVAGLIVSLLFLQFSAPDLALTQISVEVVATILLLLALNLLPKTTPSETNGRTRSVHALVAAGTGFAVMFLAYSILTRGFESISGYHLAQAKPGGGGTNVVNVILVDFRAYDTFGEIIVLGIAGIAIFALLDSTLNGRSGRRLVSTTAGIGSAEAHPLILVVATRVLLPLALTAGIYIFLRGHNLPGGGFIAGIVVAIAFIMQYIASGYAWAHARVRFDPQLMIGGGIALAGVTGLASWIFGYPLLTSTHRYFDLPILGQIELASALAFDLGVFLTVVGTVLLALASISRVEGAGDERQPKDLIEDLERPTVPTPALHIQQREKEAV